MLNLRMTENHLIYEWIGSLPVAVPDWSKLLPAMYAEFNLQYFGGRLPRITDSFVCEFCDMPRNSAGIYIDAETAAKQSTEAVKIRPGIRINSSLQTLRDHVNIALLHEMVHANGVVGHGPAFEAEILRLILAGAYKTLL
jgi:hypothetical protein